VTAARYIAVTSLLALILFADNVQAQQMGRTSAVTVGVRQYNNHPDDTEFPFGDSDLGYLMAYEFHEGNAFWQFGLGYTPSASATSQVAEVEYVITPQLHLVYQDGSLMMGVGALKHYISDTNGKHWTSIYWELMLGLQLPISTSVSIQGLACYQFRDWGNLGDFDTSEIEFGVNLSCKF